MEENFTLHFAESDSDIDLFWLQRNKYMAEDVLPNATFSPATDEDYEWFFSEEYKEHIMELFHRGTGPLRIVFLRDNGEDVGFAVYLTYHSEDGKCFILDFCVDTGRRNNGAGTLFFKMLREHAIGEGAAYFALNLSNENNERFWIRNGFVKTGKDEYGSDIYERRQI